MYSKFVDNHHSTNGNNCKVSFQDFESGKWLQNTAETVKNHANKEICAQLNLCRSLINFSISETENFYGINPCMILYEKLKDKIMNEYKTDQNKSSGFTLDLTNFSYCIAIIFIIATVMSCIWCCHRLFRACKSKCSEPSRRRAPTTATQVTYAAPVNSANRDGAFYPSCPSYSQVFGSRNTSVPTPETLF